MAIRGLVLLMAALAGCPPPPADPSRAPQPPPGGSTATSPHPGGDPAANPSRENTVNADQPCGDGVCDEPETQDPTLCPRDCQQQPSQGDDWCGDGICDAMEADQGICPADCSAADDNAADSSAAESGTADAP